MLKYYTDYVINLLRLVLCLIFINTCLFSCKRQNDKIILNENLVTFSVFPKEEKVLFENLVEDKIGVPGEFHIIDSTMIIFNNYRNKFYFHNYFFNSNIFSSEYIERGRGPNEALMGFSSGIGGDGKLWMYDMGTNKIITLPQKIALEGKKNPKLNTHLFKEKFYKVTLTPTNDILGIGSSNSKKKIQKVDIKSGNIIEEFGDFYNIPESIPLEICKKAYESNIYIKPSGDKLVLAYRYSDIIEIFNLKDYTSKAIQGVDGFDVEFDLEKSNNFNIQINEKTRHGFLRGNTTDKYIYLLYSGRPSTDSKWNSGNCVYIYDWEGNPVKKLILDRDVSKLGVSSDDKTIYSYDEETGFIIKANIN